MELVGERSDLELLREKMSIPSCRIEIEGDRVRLVSDRFDACGESSEIRIEAEKICANLNAIAKLYLGVADSIKVGDRIIERCEDGTRRRSIFFPGRVSAKPSTTSGVGPDGREIPPPEHSLTRTMQLAIADAEVAVVLGYFREGRWGDLYKVVEAIEHDVGGGDQLQKKGWVDWDQVRRLKECAENPDAAGAEARHHKYKGQRRPADPMRKREATGLVGELLRRWIEAKSAGSAGNSA